LPASYGDLRPPLCRALAAIDAIDFESLPIELRMLALGPPLPDLTADANAYGLALTAE